MIATASCEAPELSDSVSHASFERMLPLIERKAAFAFRKLTPDAREEMVAEVTANAFSAFRRLMERGCEAKAFASRLADFAIRQVCSGRRVAGKPNPRDVTAQLKRTSGRDNHWLEMLVEDRHVGPSEIAATRIDFAEWLQSLPRRKRRVATTLALGETTTETAKRHGVTHSRISQLRQELFHSWMAFQNEILDS